MFLIVVTFLWFSIKPKTSSLIDLRTLSHFLVHSPSHCYWGFLHHTGHLFKGYPLAYDIANLKKDHKIYEIKALLGNLLALVHHYHILYSNMNIWKTAVWVKMYWKVSMHKMLITETANYTSLTQPFVSTSIQANVQITSANFIHLSTVSSPISKNHRDLQRHIYNPKVHLWWSFLWK